MRNRFHLNTGGLNRLERIVGVLTLLAVLTVPMGASGSVTEGAQCHEHYGLSDDAKYKCLPGLTEEGYTKTERYKGQVVNARKGEVIMSSGCGSIGKLLRSVGQKYSHSGIMADDRYTVIHSTASVGRLNDNDASDTIFGQDVPFADGFDGDALTYLWPGTIEQTAAGAYEGSPFVDPESGKTYMIKGFSASAEKCGEATSTPPLVVKPPMPEYACPDEDDPEVLYIDHDPTSPFCDDASLSGDGHYFSSNCGCGCRPASDTTEGDLDTTWDESLVRDRLDDVVSEMRELLPETQADGSLKYRSPYRFFTYTAGDPADVVNNADSGWAKDTIPTVCSQSIWYSARNAGVHMEGSLEAEDCERGGRAGDFECNAGDIQPLPQYDGLYDYTPEERTEAAQFLKNHFVQDVLEKLEDAGDWAGWYAELFEKIPQQVSNQIVNCFANDWCQSGATPTDRFGDTLDCSGFDDPSMSGWGSDPESHPPD